MHRRRHGYRWTSRYAVTHVGSSAAAGDAHSPRAVSLTLPNIMQLIGWSYMDFSSTVRVDTSIHTIKEIIKKWHGGKIATLTVCKDSYQEMNELRHDQLTLEKCGIKGVSDKDNAPAVTLYYDFKLDGSSEPDPILMC